MSRKLVAGPRTQAIPAIACALVTACVVGGVASLVLSAGGGLPLSAGAGALSLIPGLGAGLTVAVFVEEHAVRHWVHCVQSTPVLRKDPLPGGKETYVLLEGGCELVVNTRGYDTVYDFQTGEEVPYGGRVVNYLLSGPKLTDAEKRVARWHDHKAALEKMSNLKKDA